MVWTWPLRSGPLYHHFSDFQELIETAQIQIYQEYATGISQALMDMIASCAGADDLRVRFARLVSRVSGEATVEYRLQLIGIVHNAGSTEGFRRKFLPVQEEIIGSWIELYRFCLDRGWADPTIEPRAFALLMLSTMFGRVINNTSQYKLETDVLLEYVPTLFNKFCFQNLSVPEN